MKIVPEDNRFIREVLEKEEYKYLYDYPVVIDIGANIGTFSMYIYDKADRIYDLEPVPEVFSYLMKNIEANQLVKIRPFNLAIADCNGIRKMKLDPKPDSGGSSLITGMIGGDIEVKCKRLVDFMNEEDIKYADLVKLDVEGGEEEILEGAFPADRIGTIVGECHWKHEVEGQLTAMGYRCTQSGSHFLARKI